MKIETRISEIIDKVLISHSGTESITVKDLMKLTGGRSIEIFAEGKGIKVTLTLMQDVHVAGSVLIEIKQYTNRE